MLDLNLLATPYGAAMATAAIATASSLIGLICGLLAHAIIQARAQAEADRIARARLDEIARRRVAAIVEANLKPQPARYVFDLVLNQRRRRGA